MELFTDYSGLVEWPAHTRRLFTVAEADRSLVLVERIVEDVIFEYARAAELQEAVEAAASRYDRNADDLGERMLRAVDALHACLEELDCVGVELCDWSRGIVDFPSLAAGREVRLCWRYGESGVKHWHEIDGGCAGRRPLRTLGSRQIVVV